MRGNDLADLTDELAGAELWVESLRANVRNGVTSGYSVESTTELADLLEVLHDAVYARDEALRVQAEQLDSLRNAIGNPDELRLLSNWHAMECADMHGPEGGHEGCCRDADWAIRLRLIYEASFDALAAAGGGVPETGATDG